MEIHGAKEKKFKDYQEEYQKVMLDLKTSIEKFGEGVNRMSSSTIYTFITENINLHQRFSSSAKQFSSDYQSYNDPKENIQAQIYFDLLPQLNSRLGEEAGFTNNKSRLILMNSNHEVDLTNMDLKTSIRNGRDKTPPNTLNKPPRGNSEILLTSVIPAERLNRKSSQSLIRSFESDSKERKKAEFRSKSGSENDIIDDLSD